MDILDIDEVLRNDSFTCLEGKTHDDVSNILRQWKQNQMTIEGNHLLNVANDTTITTTSMSHDEQLADFSEIAVNNNHNYNNNSSSSSSMPFKINTRTFTRPKRKNIMTGLDAHNLNSHCLETDEVVASVMARQQQQQQQQKPLLHMQIGGLVTPSLHKSMLQDTSPPASICSSINASYINNNNNDNNNMLNNSLITSADFSNLSFLRTSNSFEGDDDNAKTAHDTNNYTLQDVIRDREKLESLTMSSEDGTLIKDTQIAQIDDISLLTLSKPTSTCSTMDNSTDSVGVTNDMYGQADETYAKHTDNKENEQLTCNNFTFNFKQQQQDEKQQLADLMANETYCKPTTAVPLMEQTICLSTPTVSAANATFDKQLPETSTPESSKPMISQYSNKRQQQRMLTALSEELSPIVLDRNPHINDEQPAYDDNNTTPKTTHVNTSNNNNNNNNKSNNNKTEIRYKPNKLDLHAANNIDNLDDIDVDFYNDNDDDKYFNCNGDRDVDVDVDVDDVKNAVNRESNELALRGIAQSNERNMQHVRDLAKAEAQYLIGNENEDEFEHMLDDIGRIELNPEQVKMKRSLETIKKRLTCALNAKSVKNDECQHLDNNTTTTIMYNGDDKRNSSYLQHNNEHDGNNMTISANTPTSERLLSRRSRLYDDANLANILAASKLNSTTTTTTTTSASFNNNNSILNKQQQQQQYAELQNETYNDDNNNDDIDDDENSHKNNSKYKKLERREHCRNRFKTIKLTKERADNVPCIDDEDVQQQQQQQQYEQLENDCSENRYSRRDYQHNHNNQFNNEIVADASKYATFKKTKDKPHSNYSQLKQPYHPQQHHMNHNNNYQQHQPQQLIADNVLTTKSKLLAYNHERRSPSRPRYLSGLTKFSVVSKANSTHDLDHHVDHRGDESSAVQYVPSTSNAKAAVGDNGKLRELRSPMGIKSKSFGNLTTSNQAMTLSKLPATAVTTFGLRKGYNSQESAADARSSSSSRSHQQESKMIRPVSGIRPAYGVVATKRSGLVRPSSAYYNYNSQHARSGTQLGSTSDVTLAASQETLVLTDNIESLSSGSSARSGASDRTTARPMANYNSTVDTKTKTSVPTKPSALRPPTIIKRSALPRPTSYAKR